MNNQHLFVHAEKLNELLQIRNPKTFIEALKVSRKHYMETMAKWEINNSELEKTFSALEELEQFFIDIENNKLLYPKVSKN